MTTTPRAFRRASGVIAGVALVATMALTGTPASAASGDEHLAGLEYVALGDSYAAGFGLTPLSGLPSPECAQSRANYPHSVATELGLVLTDRTCSGAATVNLTTTPQTLLPSATTVAVQDASLSASTDIVTVTIGGNDLGFVDILTACAALSATGPVVGDPASPLSVNDCTSLFVPVPGTDLLAIAIAGVVAPALDAAFADIAAKAPNAKIFVVGYPALTPAAVPAEGCFRTALGDPFPVNAYPYRDVDLTYLHGIEVLLDQALATAAANNGATYLSALADTESHTPCSTTDPYVNGVTVTSLTLSPTFTIALAPGVMHPNAAGVDYLATQLEDAIRDAFPAPVEPGPDPETTPAGELAATGANAGLLGVVGTLALLAGALVLGWRRSLARD